MNSSPLPAEITAIAAQCQPIELLLADVDGVLTDGGVVFDNQGIEIKRFHIRDGLGIRLWQRAGYRIGLITGRTSHIVKIRSSELGIDLVRQGVEDKWPAAEAIIAAAGLEPHQVAYIGDDLPDLPVIRRVGLGVTVADAPAELREAATFVTTQCGGHGALRELIEAILRNQGRWADLIHKYQE